MQPIWPDNLNKMNIKTIYKLNLMIPAWIFLNVFLCYCNYSPDLADLNKSEQLILIHAYLEPVYPRAGNQVDLHVGIFNDGGKLNGITADLILPKKFNILSFNVLEAIPGLSNTSFSWQLVAPKEGVYPVRIVIKDSLTLYVDTCLYLQWHSQLKPRQEAYVPRPERAQTGNYELGVFRCPLWNSQTRPGSWDPVKKFPERKPILGWYEEGNPEVTDWEIKYAVEHGISFFVECWYRKKDNLGKPAEYVLGHWLESLSESRYKDEIRYMIMWENRNKIACGIESEADLMNNLMPFWIDNYFSQPNYFRVDGKPVLMIYGYDVFIRELGGEQQAAHAIAKMKQACISAGLNGLWVLAEHHLHFNRDIPEAKNAGFDAITSYHWPSFTGMMRVVPDDRREIVAMQKACWPMLEEISQLPSIPTVSMGWDSEPWGSTYYKGKWFLEPDLFREMCHEAKNFMDQQPERDPFSDILLIDNWNEFGEGHYIFPTRRFGFGHLEAIRTVFTDNAASFQPIVPEDVGLGPYEAY